MPRSVRRGEQFEDLRGIRDRHILGLQVREVRAERVDAVAELGEGEHVFEYSKKRPENKKNFDFPSPPHAPLRRETTTPRAKKRSRPTVTLVEKLVYLIWDRPRPVRPPTYGPATARRHCPPPARASAVRGLQIDVDDEAGPNRLDGAGSRRRASPSPRACRSGSTRTTTGRPSEAILDEVGVRRAGYLVTESLYRDYGGNRSRRRVTGPTEGLAGHHHAHPVRKRLGVTKAGYGHWYGEQSPASESMEPRARYVRNAVVPPRSTPRRARRLASLTPTSVTGARTDGREGLVRRRRAVCRTRSAG